MTSEHNELTRALASEWGQDLLGSLPLVTSHIQSGTITGILRDTMAQIMEVARDRLGMDVCLVAFGSLGRLEFVPGASDLDPIILVPGSVDRVMADACRSAVLTPLANMAPWLGFDERHKVIAGDWNAVDRPDLRFPVIGTEEMIAGREGVLAQRRWQLLLEGRALWNPRLFNETFERVLPRLQRSRALLDDEGLGSDHEIDLVSLCQTAPSFFGNFDNPAFLYKSQLKYWKTRFLRDFFTFSSQLLFVLGWYLQREGDHLPPTFVRAATITKLIRAVRFAEQVDRECRENAVLERHYLERVGEILNSMEIAPERVIVFGTRYRSHVARLLHGLLLSVLTRYVRCWDRIYDPHVRSVLAELPATMNFESRFEQQVQNADARNVLAELLELRSGYRRYMAATARTISEVFLRGRIWAKYTIPPGVYHSLQPFEQGL